MEIAFDAQCHRLFFGNFFFIYADFLESSTPVSTPVLLERTLSSLYSAEHAKNEIVGPREDSASFCAYSKRSYDDNGLDNLNHGPDLCNLNI